MKRNLVLVAMLAIFSLVATGAFADQQVITKALQYPAQELSESEKNGLLLMREEEKLARDVYTALSEKWGLPIFSNIARSEQQHMNMVLPLLERYQIADPVGADTPGVFRDANLQTLYDKLVEEGSISVLEALNVGAEVEELDIADLMTLMGETDNRDIRLVYQNLMKGSRNHLRSFNQQITIRGGNFDPRHLTVNEFQDIVSGLPERGPILDPDAPY